jgi:hypothetical protein
VKRQRTLRAPGADEADDGRLTDLSAEALLQREIAELAEWLAAQGLEPRDDDDHAHEGSRDRLYWRFGYFVGLKQALAMLTNRGATVH